MNLTQLSLTLFSIACISISVQSTELQPLPTHTSGRALVTTDGSGNKVYEYSWPAIYFETAFNGDSLTIKFDDDQNNFHLIINNRDLCTTHAYFSNKSESVKKIPNL